MGVQVEPAEVKVPSGGLWIIFIFRGSKMKKQLSAICLAIGIIFLGFSASPGTYDPGVKTGPLSEIEFLQGKNCDLNSHGPIDRLYLIERNPRYWKYQWLIRWIKYTGDGAGIMLRFTFKDDNRRIIYRTYVNFWAEPGCHEYKGTIYLDAATAEKWKWVVMEWTREDNLNHFCNFDLERFKWRSLDNSHLQKK